VSLIESITRGAIGFRADASGTPAPWDDYWYSPLGYDSATGMRVSPESAKRLAAVHACVSIISRNIAMMPCRLYTSMAGDGKKVVVHHPVYDLLYSQPNAQQTAYEFKQMMQGHFELRGNAYAEIVPGPRGAVDQLIPLHPDRVRVERLLPSGRLRYVYNDPLVNQTRNLMQDEVFHLRGWSDDGMTGQSTIAMAVDTFGVALAQQDYTARFLKNDAKPGTVIENTNFKTKEDELRFRESWQRSQTGENRHKTALLPLGLTIKELGVKPIDAQLLDSRKFSRIEICSIFGVPPHLIGETEKTATYASVEQFNIMFAVQCILPRLVMWEQAIQRDLILNPRYFAKFSMAALLRGDTASRYAAYKVAVENGWMCQDDVRELEDLNPIPGGKGKTYWRPSNWLPLDQIQQSPAAPAPATPGSTDTADPQQDPASARLLLLASDAASRCVRREVNGAKKLVERNANDYEVAEFYSEQERFICDVLRLPAETVSAVRSQMAERAGRLEEFIVAGDRVRASAWLDQVAIHEPVRLATIAVQGVIQ